MQSIEDVLETLRVHDLISINYHPRLNSQALPLITTYLSHDNEKIHIGLGRTFSVHGTPKKILETSHIEYNKITKLEKLTPETLFEA